MQYLQNIFFKFICFYLKISWQHTFFYAIMPMFHIRPVGQAAKTAPSHGAIMGSIPVRVTKTKASHLRCFFVLFWWPVRESRTHTQGLTLRWVRIRSAEASSSLVRLKPANIRRRRNSRVQAHATVSGRLTSKVNFGIMNSLINKNLTKERIDLWTKTKTLI